jgi:hypothetical protein
LLLEVSFLSCLLLGCLDIHGITWSVRVLIFLLDLSWLVSSDISLLNLLFLLISCYLSLGLSFDLGPSLLLFLGLILLSLHWFIFARCCICSLGNICNHFAKILKFRQQMHFILPSQLHVYSVFHLVKLIKWWPQIFNLISLLLS